MKELLFSVTAKDCRWDLYSGTGGGGQHRNKCKNSVRCHHDPSGAVGKSEDERYLSQNRQIAFRRMAESQAFQKWARLKAQEAMGTASSDALREKLSKMKSNASFGHQIRSYVYHRDVVVDHRTEQEIHDVDHVLDGRLDAFIDELIRLQAGE